MPVFIGFQFVWLHTTLVSNTDYGRPLYIKKSRTARRDFTGMLKGFIVLQIDVDGYNCLQQLSENTCRLPNRLQIIAIDYRWLMW